MNEPIDTSGPPTHLVYMTVGSHEEAMKIAGVVVQERLAACANVFPGVVSIYEWNGKMQQDEETVVILKTHESRVNWLTDRLVQLHSFDCPCVVSVPIASGNVGYLEWVRDQTRENP